MQAPHQTQRYIKLDPAMQVYTFLYVVKMFVKLFLLHPVEIFVEVLYFHYKFCLKKLSHQYLALAQIILKLVTLGPRAMSQ